MHYNPDGSVSEGERLSYVPPEITSSEKAARESDLRDTIAEHLEEMGVDPTMTGHFVNKLVTLTWLPNGAGLVINDRNHAVYAKEDARELITKIPKENGGKQPVPPAAASKETQAQMNAKRADVAREF